MKEKKERFHLEKGNIDDAKVKIVEQAISEYAQGMTSVTEKPEIAEILKEIFADLIDEKLGMTTMDMKARLHPIEASAINVFDALVQFRFLPQEALPVSRQKKRLSVSHFGKGREEAVEISTAGINRKNPNFGERLKNVFAPTK